MIIEQLAIEGMLFAVRRFDRAKKGALPCQADEIVLRLACLVGAIAGRKMVSTVERNNLDQSIVVVAY
jgi:hypothetical protein